ncbi:MAG: tetratricopeptide repeat protein, partial [Bdellovibrionales bacterium]|nr:tetratricopeptide repeat protein [Bdellovibrionales bacterium]
MSSNRSSAKYKIKLQSGRVLGPLDIDQLRALVKKGHIRGDELVRAYPDGDWRALGQYAELANLVIAFASGEQSGALTKDSIAATAPIRGQAAPTQILAATQILPHEESSEEADGKSYSFEISQPQPEKTSVEKSGPIPTAPSVILESSPGLSSKSGENAEASEEQDDRTIVAPMFEQESEDGTRVSVQVDSQVAPRQNNIFSEKTVIFERSTDSKKLPGKKAKERGSPLRRLVMLLGTIWAAVEILSDFQSPGRKAAERIEELRPRLPSVVEKQVDSKKSNKLYTEGLEYYRRDTIPDFKKAVFLFTRAVETDAQNVKALAMLASSYLNLIDVSNKDENYFSVVRKLIDLSKAKEIDLTETIIAEVEYLLFIQQPAAAQTRLIEYTQKNKNYDPIMFMYLAQVLIARGDYASAARYLNPLTEDRLPNVRVYYLRGIVAEGLGDLDSALEQYRRAVKINPMHGLSHFRILKILEAR